MTPRHVIDRAFRQGTVKARADGSVHELFPVAIPAEEGEALRSWVVSEGAHTTIETGLGYAISTLFHRFDGVFLDLFYLGRLVQPGRVIVVDDYQLPGVARAAAFFITNLDWTLEEVSAQDELHQWAVLRTSEIPDERPFDRFVDF